MPKKRPTPVENGERKNDGANRREMGMEVCSACGGNERVGKNIPIQAAVPSKRDRRFRHEMQDDVFFLARPAIAANPISRVRSVNSWQHDILITIPHDTRKYHRGQSHGHPEQIARQRLPERQDGSDPMSAAKLSGPSQGSGATARNPVSAHLSRKQKYFRVLRLNKQHQ